MFESRHKVIAPALALAISTMALIGCSASKDGDPYPQPITTFKADFNPTAAFMPYPIDLYFFDSTDTTGAKMDGTLQIVPGQARGFPRSDAMAAALNAMDGWSTTAPITASFNLPIDAATLNGSTVHMVEMYLDNVYKTPIQTGNPVSKVLEYGADYTVSVSDDIDSAGKFLMITPTKPLRASTGATNVGYMVVLTKGIKSADGRVVEPDTLYATVKGAASCGATDLVCNTIKAQLYVASHLDALSPGATAVPESDIVLSWSFTTQSVDDTFNYIAAAVPGPTPVVIPTGMSTAAVGGAGYANIYVGKTEVPYYLTAAANNKDTSINTRFWTAAGPPTTWPNQASRNLTRFNPVPAATNPAQKIPLLVSVPNANAAAGACTQPTAGWPVVIYQHGITSDRSSMLALADTYAAAACMVVAAIDLPLHGVTATDAANPLSAFHCFAPPAAANPLCLGAVERTFDVDLDTTPGIDASGSYFINLTSPATGRDNLRQAEADLIVFTKSIAKLDLTGDGISDIDPTKIHFNGISLGGIVGGTHVHFVKDLRTAALSVPGGVVTKLLLDSDSFGPRIKAGVTASFVENSYNYNLFFRDFQSVIDSGDPINHILDAATMHPIYLQKVIGDHVVPNSATDRLIAVANTGDTTMTRVSSGAANPVAPGAGIYVEFPYGQHASLLTDSYCNDPSLYPTPDLKLLCQQTTTEMRLEAALYAATSNQYGTPMISVVNPAVVQQ